MAVFRFAVFLCVTLTLLVSLNQTFMVSASSSTTIGVCYATLGDNLPPPCEVITLLRKYDITQIRLVTYFDNAIQALSMPIAVSLGTPNQKPRRVKDDFIL